MTVPGGTLYRTQRSGAVWLVPDEHGTGHELGVALGWCVPAE